MIKSSDTTSQNKLREEIQQKAVDLSINHKRLILEFATGVGKSLAAVKIIAESINNQDKTPWHIVVWETKHIQNWKDDIIKHGFEWILDHVSIYCYASLKKQALPDVHYVCDEGHHMFGAVYYEYFLNYANNRLVVLTATLSSDKKAKLRTDFPKIKTYTITLSQAINAGLLPRPNIYKVPISFDSFNYDHTIIIQKGGKAKWSKLEQREVKYGDHFKYLKGAKVVNMKVVCTAAQKLKHMNSNVDYWQQLYFKSREEYQKTRWLRAGLDRKRFIAEAKTKAAAKLIQKLDGMRKIIFCGSVDQAIALGEEHTTIHSRVSSKVSQQVVDNFNAKVIDSLYTNQMAREGMNLYEIDAGVVIQLDKESLGFVQMMGRVLRAKNPHVFVLVAPGSQDDKYFDSSVLGIDTDLFRPYSDFTLLNP